MSWSLSASGHTTDESGLVEAVGAVLADPRWGTASAQMYATVFVGDPRTVTLPADPGLPTLPADPGLPTPPAAAPAAGAGG